MRRLVLGPFFYLMCGSVWAQSSLDFTIHQDYISTRAMGMGNAFSAVVDDHSAMFYNPAMLALRESGNVRLFLRGAIDPDYIKLFEDIDKASKATNEEQAIVDLLNSKYGDHYFSRVPTLGGVWVRPNWGVAFIPLDFSTDLNINRGALPTLNVSAYADTTLAYGYARKVKWKHKNELYWGATAKVIHRVYVGDVIPAAELLDDSDVFKPEDADEGLTFDLDIGTLYRPKFSEKSWWRFAKPQFALVVRNAVDMGFPVNLNVVDENSGEPPNLQRRIDVGTKLDLPRLWVFDPHFAFDVRDMLHDKWTLQKGLHAGVELYWTMFNWWKGYWSAGYNQGYYTLGLGARMAWFNIDLATWGEEVGVDDAKTESRRYMVELSLDF